METEPSKIATVRPTFDVHTHSAPHYHVPSQTSATIPSALVVSGLEHTTPPAQRSLHQVLQEGRIVLDHHSSGQPNHIWKLPHDFIMIYVCPLDAYERPAILRTLVSSECLDNPSWVSHSFQLDRFAMSTDVTISSTVCQAYAAYHSTVSTPRSASFQSLTPHSPLSPVYSPDSTSAIPSPRLRGSPLNSTLLASAPSLPVINAHELSYLRSLTGPAPPALRQASDPDPDPSPDAYTSIHPTLNVYLLDLFAAARHHPLVDGTLLTLRAHRDAEDLIRAFRVICGSSLGAELISTVAAAPEADADIHGSEDSATDELLPSPIDDVHSLDWEKPEADWLGEEIRIGKRKASSLRSVEVKIQGPTDRTAPVPFDTSSENAGSHADWVLPPAVSRRPEVWDVSEVDVGKIFPRVVSHRVRMRAGPDDEILGSVMFPAAAGATGTGGADAHRVRRADDRTVKQVIVSILADV